MAQPNPSEEIPGGPNLACENLTVRGTLQATTGISVVTDGVTLQGDGSGGSPVAVKAVQHDATLAGDGTVATPLAVAAALNQGGAGKSLTVGDLRSGVLAAALVADVNDWAPAGGDVATVFVVTPTGATRTITGLANGVAGRVVCIVNPASTGFNVTIAGESAASVAANRFRPNDGSNGSLGMSLRPSSAEWFVYNAVQQRWQGLGKLAGGNLVGDANVTSNGSMNVAGNIACGSITVTGNAALSQTSMFGTATPITADVNDWIPNSFNISTRVDMAPDAARAITGIAQGFSNRLVILHNPTAFAVTLRNQDAASVAANRFALPGGVDYVVAAGMSVMLFYNGGTARWNALVFN